jgi:thioredoxin-like negative regulator of GroEL
VFCRRLGSPLVAVFLFLPGCIRRESPAVQQLAVAPFENLSSDSRLDWACRAAAAAIVYDLAGSPDIHAQSVDSSSGAYAVLATRVLHGYFSERNGRLEIRAVIEDLQRTKTVASFQLDAPAVDGWVPVLNQLAKRVSAGARPFGTGNPQAFRAYGEALQGGDRAAVQRGFESATTVDPRFIAAYVGWAGALFAAGDRAAGLQALAAAKRQTQDALDRAEVDYLSASAVGDANDRAAALENLTRLTPADSKALRELAGLQVSQRRFPDAVRTYEAATRVAPDVPGIWNELGYAHAFAQDLPGARRAIEHYRQLSPDDANALDSLGEVSFYLGDFANAAQAFLDADTKNSAAFGGVELTKAAQARLMTGDLAGADALFARFLGLAQPAQRATAGYQQAQWEFLTGRRKAGMARIEQLLAALQGDTQTLALCQLSIWKLQTGDAKAAADLAARASATAQSPQARNLAATFRDPFALLLARKYAEARPALEAKLRETNPAADGQIRTVLAWDYVELGRIEEARKLLALYPIPLSSGDPLFASLIFPRFLNLRGLVLEKEGKSAEAKQSYDLYRKYAGDLPDVFGNEEKARSVL